MGFWVVTSESGGNEGRVSGTEAMMGDEGEETADASRDAVLIDSDKGAASADSERETRLGAT
jgi:hypothetical protein